jgi:hypothetical protein
MTQPDLDALAERRTAIDRKKSLQLLGGALAALAALFAERRSAGAGKPRRRKKRRKAKRRCIAIGMTCLDGGKPCCDGLTCGGPPPDTFCCKQGGEPCRTARDCCNLQCFEGSCALN